MLNLLIESPRLQIYELRSNERVDLASYGLLLGMGCLCKILCLFLAEIQRSFMYDIQALVLLLAFVRKISYKVTLNRMEISYLRSLPLSQRIAQSV